MTTPIKVYEAAAQAAGAFGYGGNLSDAMDAAHGVISFILPERRVEWMGLTRPSTARIYMMCAMPAQAPSNFFKVLANVGLLGVHFPELEALLHVPAGPLPYHPEGDALTHTLLVLDEAVKLGCNTEERVAALLHDLGKATTKPSILPHHYGHEARGVDLVLGLGKRLGLSEHLVQAAVVMSREHQKVHRFLDMRPIKQAELVANCEPAFSRGIEGLALVCDADKLGRAAAGKPSKGAEAMRRLARALDEADPTDVLRLINQGIISARLKKELEWQ